MKKTFSNTNAINEMLGYAPENNHEPDPDHEAIPRLQVPANLPPHVQPLDNHIIGGDYDLFPGIPAPVSSRPMVRKQADDEEKSMPVQGMKKH